jgi:hypothetical protein
MNYGNNDVRVLNALLRGEVPTIGSEHRVHLEMLGLVVDGARGLRITPKGIELAVAVPLRPETIFDTRERLEVVGLWRASDEGEIGNKVLAVVTTPPGTESSRTAVPAAAG